MKHNINLDLDSRLELAKAFQPIDRVMNRKLVMVDLWEFMIPDCKGVIIPLKNLKKIFSKFELGYFEEAVDHMNKLMEDVTRGHVSCFFGLSNVLSLYLTLRHAVEGYIEGKGCPKDFDHAMILYSKCFEVSGVELSKINF